MRPTFVDAYQLHPDLAFKWKSSFEITIKLPSDIGCRYRSDGDVEPETILSPEHDIPSIDDLLPLPMNPHFALASESYRLCILFRPPAAM
jgi:hypothetical protein